MKTINTLFLTLSVALLSTSTAMAKPDPVATWTDPVLASKESPVFHYMGEYTKGDQGLQVNPDRDKFYVAQYQGGLPGAGWDNKTVSYHRLTEAELTALLKGFKKVDRGVKEGSYPAPDNATIIFDGKDTSELKNAQIINEQLVAGAITKNSFTDFHLHAEFSVPYKPERPLGNSDRGNSGLYLFMRYEVQIMDCFGLPYNNDVWQQQNLQMPSPEYCSGALYKFKAPNINWSLPALTWQSYDVHFTAPRFEEGKKIKNARITVYYNGIKIHDDVELLKGTGAQADKEELAQGPILFQKHNNLTHFRNIWLVKK